MLVLSLISYAFLEKLGICELTQIMILLSGSKSWFYCCCLWMREYWCIRSLFAGRRGRRSVWIPCAVVSTVKMFSVCVPVGNTTCVCMCVCVFITTDAFDVN